MIRDKKGQLIDSKLMSQFFASVNPPGANRLTDPYVLYDPDSQRFFLANANRVHNPDCEVGTCVSVILLAVSKNADPRTLNTSDWHLYALDRTLRRFPDGTVIAKTIHGDYDHLAIIGDALVISHDATFFDRKKYPGNTGNIRILDKWALVSGKPVTDWVDLEVPSANAIVSINFGHPNVAFLFNWRTGCEIEIRGISDPLVSPSLKHHTLQVAMPCPLSYRYAPIHITKRAQAVYRDGSLWIVRTIQHNDTTAIHWAQIDVSKWPQKPEITQQGILGADNTWYFAPAVIVDASNNVAILYGRISDTEFLSAYFTGRLASDPPNTLRIGTKLKEGMFAFEDIFPDGRNRFTDYLGIALDPADESIWMLGMYAKETAEQGTWVGNLVLVP